MIKKLPIRFGQIVAGLAAIAIITAGVNAMSKYDESIQPPPLQESDANTRSSANAGIVRDVAEPSAFDEDYADYLTTYFPEASEFDPSIPAPADILGYAPGEFHITPEMLFVYVRALAAASPKAQMEVIGYSHEKRPLAHLYISSPENIAKLEEVRNRHLDANSPDEDILVLKLAYSIHGNEPSGSNAVPLIAYYLTAAKDAWVDAFLERTIIIIEPSQNPDGLTRFAQWANGHRTLVDNPDTEQRNHHGPWPSGRTNHYWFDLNRDWIFLVHPESRARIHQFHRWEPHILGDYHEMGGTKPSYFFQPGHPKRTHPLTLPENQRITFELAKFHAKALDAAGQDYYSQERFDDFYYGKGSTYPDINGGIGVLFEQTAVRGQLRDFDGELLTFRQSIANQVTTSFSLMRGADAMRDEILAYRFSFREEEKKRARSARAKGYVVGIDNDPARAQALADMLSAHKINVHLLAKTIIRDGIRFEKGKALIIPADASQFGLVTSLFEMRTTFEDNVFYDVSTWNLPTAFNLPFAAVNNVSGLLGEPVRTLATSNPVEIDGSAIAYAISWNQLEAPKLLEILLAEGVFPRVASKPFGADLVDGTRQMFAPGTIILRLRDQAAIDALALAASKVPSVTMQAIATGLTYEGPDLGSRAMKAVYPVRLALLVGDGVSPVEAGSIWYFLDMRVGAPVTLLDIDRVRKADLSNYTHILMANGSYGDLSDAKEELNDWVRDGGVLVAQKRAAAWVNENLLKSDKDEKKEDAKGEGKKDKGAEKENKGDDEPEYRAYQDFERDNGDRLVRGSVFEANADLTHPFAYGFQREKVPLFRTWNETIPRADISYDTPFRYTEEPLISGFVSDVKLAELAGSPAVAAHRHGKGTIVTVADDLVFRGLWRGTERIYANIIYFAQTIEARSDAGE